MSFTNRGRAPHYAIPHHIFTDAKPYRYAVENKILHGSTGDKYYPHADEVPHIHMQVSTQTNDQIKVWFISIKVRDDGDHDRQAYKLKVTKQDEKMLYKFRNEGLPGKTAERFKELLVKLKMCHP